MKIYDVIVHNSAKADIYGINSKTPHWGRFPMRRFAALKHSPAAGGQADVGKGGRVLEHRPYLGFAVAGNAAAYWGYQKLVLGMLTGEGYEAVNGEFEAVQAFHSTIGDGSVWHYLVTVGTDLLLFERNLCVNYKNVAFRVY